MPFGLHLQELIFLGLSLLWIWALVDCLINKRLSSTQRVICFIAIFFTHILGAVIYAILRISTLPSSTSKRALTSEPQEAPSAIKAEPQGLQSYNEGYRAHRRSSQKAFEEERNEVAQTHKTPSSHEQPIAMYPEQPQ